MNPRTPRLVPAAVAALVLIAAALATPAAARAQSTLERTPNLSAGWIGLPGMVQFHVLQRFVDAPGAGTDLASSPTLLLAAGLPWHTLVGAAFSANSAVAPDEPDELELFARVRPLEQAWGALADVTLQAGFNTAAESLDGELQAARWFGPLRLLAAARAFTDAFATGDARAALAAGVVLHPLPGRAPIALAADVATPVDRRSGERAVWGVALQVGVSFTPATLSLQATNAASGTLQGASLGRSRTRFGFELTTPVPLGRFTGYYAARERAARYVRPRTVRPPDVVVPIRRYAFVPDRLVVPAGATVEWVNLDAAVHTATADDASWNSGAIRTGERWRATFTRRGVYPYHCGPHPFMRGTIIVR